MFDGSKGTASQSGVNFRSICGVCNNERLGGGYDEALGSVCKAAAPYLAVEVPSAAAVQIAPHRPARVARAVVGHVLAAFVPEDIDAPPAAASYLDALRAYFLDPSLPMPAPLEIFYWAYPFDDVRIIAAAGYMDTRSPRRTTVMFSALKFSPLAFLLMWERPEWLTPPRRLWRLDRTAVGLDEQRPFVLDPHPARRLRPDFPENPGDHGFVLLNDQAALVARRRRPRAC